MKWKSNNLSELRQQYIGMLAGDFGKEESRQMTDILIEHFFGITRVDLALEPEIRLNESEMLQLHMAVKDLLNHKPVQYITGKASFLDLMLHVNPSVLIPRPETEELVQLIIKNEQNTNSKIIDIGTGSGCIVLALKKHLPETVVTAVDISTEALETANENSRLNGLDIRFEQMDILNPETYASFPVYDVVVSNPPYVTESDKALMQPNVLENEPHAALFVADDRALLFYEAVLDFCRTHLAANGRVYFEINENKGKDIVSLLAKRSYINISLHKDIRDKDRFVSAVKG